MISRELYTKIYVYALICIMVSLPLSIRFNSYSIFLSGAIWLCDKNIRCKLKQVWQNPITRWMWLFYGCYIFSAVVSINTKEGLAILERRAALFVLPLLLIGGELKKEEIKSIALSFVSGVVVAGLVCIIYACLRFRIKSDYSVFFYQDLTKLIEMNAVYLAAYALIAIHIVLFYRVERLKMYEWATIMFLIIFCLLLNSKMMLFVGCLSGLIFFFWYYPIRKAFLGTSISLCVLIAMVFVIPNIRQRIQEELQTNWEVIYQTSFKYDTPFTGASLRLVFWRYSFEALSSEKAWLVGVGSGDFQDVLNQKYKSTGIYTGSLHLGDTGYLGYGPHNQFIEILLSMGVLGLLIFLGLLVALIRKAWQQKNYLSTQCFLVFGCFFMSESLLSTNKGIIAFTFLVLLFYIGQKKDEYISKC
jgi:O-antigen ligase